MDLKDFVKKVVVDLDQAVSEAAAEMVRDIRFMGDKGSQQVIKFDIAISADKTDTKAGKTGVRVLQFAEAGGKIESQQKNSTVSRVQFGLYIGYETKAEEERSIAR